MTALLWLRRDLRRHDHPALAAAAADGPVVPVFVLDPAFWDDAGPVRRGWLAATLLATADDYDGALCVRQGDARTVIPALAAQWGATSVHVTRETEPAGSARDEAVAAALAASGVAWVETGSPYAVTPGRVVTRQGRGFAVFTPFLRAWRAHGRRGPAVEPSGLVLRGAASDPGIRDRLDAAVAACPVPLPEAGQRGAAAAWMRFLDEGLGDYAARRDLAAVAGTSRLSPYLALGAVHPRTLLADLDERPGEGAERFVAELAWREFYADVLWRHPLSASTDLRDDLDGLAYDEPGVSFQAWCAGRTGYPLVDAGMRQLLAEGWMHNRVRMVVASFLTKDLHVWWPHGARYFMQHLLDGDPASNSHGWQWVAGTGTDASPYFRVFNPVAQSERFDPAGAYVRRYVPELAHLTGAAALTPWDQPDGYAHGYPHRIVDHAGERVETLARYERARASRR